MNEDLWVVESRSREYKGEWGLPSAPRKWEELMAISYNNDVYEHRFICGSVIIHGDLLTLIDHYGKMHV